MSKKIPDNLAKYKCDRAVYLRAKNNWGSWIKPAELVGVTESHLKSCLKRCYPGQDYCSVKKQLCSCVIRLTKMTPACGYDFIVELKALKVCPKRKESL